jgi:hypothetical protein
MESGSSTVQSPGMATTRYLLCRLSVHRWMTRHNDEGQKYVTCRRCGKDGTTIQAQLLL